MISLEERWAPLILLAQDTLICGRNCSSVQRPNEHFLGQGTDDHNDFTVHKIRVYITSEAIFDMKLQQFSFKVD